ncbi:hypothetical protein C5167_037002 [Papaver somniferum]|uniref:Uncharacterized protein n=1 Tax=Papaver somniferum TaxID=3469 RepID=A0A4Y7I897_PAPSO|nr:hypothetical protein C5167_037002 [Papaver somniferum]
MPTSPVDAQRPGSVQTLASVLASGDPEHQRVMLGEHLFPLVEALSMTKQVKSQGCCWRWTKLKCYIYWRHLKR